MKLTRILTATLTLALMLSVGNSTALAARKSTKKYVWTSITVTIKGKDDPNHWYGYNRKGHYRGYIGFKGKKYRKGQVWKVSFYHPKGDYNCEHVTRRKEARIK